MKKKLKKKHTTKKRKSIFKKAPFWWSVFFVFFCAIGFYFFFLYPYFYIKEIKVEGLDIENIEDMVNPHIEKNFPFFSSESIFFVSLSGIEEEILSNFHEIKNVNARRVFPHTVNIKITKRSPFLSWCNENQCFKIDEEGVVFKEGREKILLYKDVNKDIGEKVITKDEVVAIKKIINNIEGVQSFTILPSKMEVKTDKNYSIYFLIEDDIDRQIENLQFTLKEKINNPEEIDYIDVRYGDSVYYR